MQRKICKKCSLEKDISDFNKDKKGIFGVRYDCKQCRSEGTKKRRALNPEPFRKAQREKRAKNPEKYRQHCRDSIKRNLEKNPNYVSECNRKYYEKHRDKILIQAKEYRDNNRHIASAYEALRREAVRRATPSWADKKAITEIYKKRVDISKATGVPHSVDHIIPLTNKYVCGLHVDYNLQVITSEENNRKYNKFNDE